MIRRIRKKEDLVKYHIKPGDEEVGPLGEIFIKGDILDLSQYKSACGPNWNNGESKIKAKIKGIGSTALFTIEIVMLVYVLLLIAHVSNHFHFKFLESHVKFGENILRMFGLL